MSRQVPMRVFVVGGTRFIGLHAVQLLVEAGHHVTVYHRGEHEAHLPSSVEHSHSAEAGMPVLEFPPDLDADVVLHMTPMGEADAQAAVRACRGKVGRIVAISSGDVYRAYGKFLGIEPGPVDAETLVESSPLRSVLYPYRSKASSPEDSQFNYEKTLAEGVLLAAATLPATVLRLPKVYGPRSNQDLASVYGARAHPEWRWTHGYVENVAWAIALAVMNEVSAGKIYNVGEEYTPTVAERLHTLPERDLPLFPEGNKNFSQNIVYDTTLIRTDLGFKEIVGYEEGLQRTFTRDDNH